MVIYFVYVGQELRGGGVHIRLPPPVYATFSTDVYFWIIASTK